ncbi:MAG: YceI family protein [Nonlabens sp.]
MKYLHNSIIAIVLIAVVNNMCLAQSKFIDKKGIVSFEASEETFEPVKATNNVVTAIFNSANGEIASLVLMKGFRFKNSLMEEHFNENYIESDKYPKAILRGVLQEFDLSSLKEESRSFILDGTIEMRGKSKVVKVPLSLEMEGGSITVNGSFTVSASDFDIEIPSIVRKKISEEIKVVVNFNMKKK